MFRFAKKAKGVPEASSAVETVRVDENFRHIAFIMDGNGRWAKKRGMPREFGHKEGAENFRRISTYCKDVGFKAVTFYAFSTENWKRPQHEVDAIMKLLGSFLDELIRDFEKYPYHIRFIGDVSVLTPELQEKIAHAESLYPDAELIVNIALNYGGRAEIVYACNKLIAEGKSEITEDDISRSIYTHEREIPI